MRIEGAVVLITGAAGGIGSACATECRRRGATIALTDIESPSAELLQSCDLFVEGDITSERVRADVVARTLAKFGRLDLVINNAGVGLYAPAHDAPVELVRRVFELNLLAALGIAQATAPHLARTKGVLVNIGSIGGDVALPWASLYCASKFALHAVSDSLRRELKPQGVRVITVKPGVVATKFREHVLAGDAPSSVERIRAIPTADLASAICRKIEGWGSTLYKPWYGRFFSFADRVAPWISDLYIRRHMQPYPSLAPVQELFKTAAASGHSDMVGRYRPTEIRTYDSAGT